MFKKSLILLWSLSIMAVISIGSARAADKSDPENTLYLDLKDGRVTIQLMPDIAPKHVERVKQLAREHFYDGLKWHRVIDGFMAQTGDPTGTGSGGSNYPDLKAEFSQYQYKRGTIGAARTSDPDSANSQFFICFTDDGCSSLTGQYTVWGQVTDGMDAVDKIAKGEPPSNPDKIVKVTVAADEGKSDAASTDKSAGDKAAPAEEKPAAGGAAQ
jgi:peptidylprolyl isomerase